jgi:hypothetical protein
MTRSCRFHLRLDDRQLQRAERARLAVEPVVERWWVAAATAVALAVGGVVAAGFGSVQIGAGAGVGVVTVAVVGALLGWVAPDRKRSRLWGRPVTVVIDEAGLRIRWTPGRAADRELALDWSAFPEAVWFDDGLLLRQGTWIPFDALVDGNPQALREVVGAHVAHRRFVAEPAGASAEAGPWRPPTR